MFVSPASSPGVVTMSTYEWSNGASQISGAVRRARPGKMASPAVDNISEQNRTGTDSQRNAVKMLRFFFGLTITGLRYWVVPVMATGPIDTDPVPRPERIVVVGVL